STGRISKRLRDVPHRNRCLAGRNGRAIQHGSHKAHNRLESHRVRQSKSSLLMREEEYMISAIHVAVDTSVTARILAPDVSFVSCLNFKLGVGSNYHSYLPGQWPRAIG